MRPIARFGHLASSTVTIAPRTGFDGEGKDVYGAAVTYKAHLTRETRMVRTNAQAEASSSQSVSIIGFPAVAVTSLLTLTAGDMPGDTNVLDCRIVAVRRRYDKRGPHSTVIYLE